MDFEIILERVNYFLFGCAVGGVAFWLLVCFIEKLTEPKPPDLINQSDKPTRSGDNGTK